MKEASAGLGDGVTHGPHVLALSITGEVIFAIERVPSSAAYTSTPFHSSSLAPQSPWRFSSGGPSLSQRHCDKLSPSHPKPSQCALFITRH